MKAIRRGDPRLALVVLVLLYLLVRLPRLDVLPPFDDESDYAWDALLIVAGVRGHAWDWLFISLHDGVPPLFSWLTALLLGLPFDAILVGRLVSVAAGAATTALLYVTGRAWCSPRAGLFAALLYIISPFALFTDRIGLLDGILAFWVTLGGVLAWPRKDAPPRGMSWRSVGAGAALGAALLTKSLGLVGLLLPALALWRGPQTAEGAVSGSPRGRWLTAELTYLVALLTWSVLLFSGRVAALLYPFRLQAGMTHGPPSPVRLLGTMGTVGGYAGTYLTPPLALALGVALLWTLWRGRPPARYLALWVALAGAALLATAGPFFPPRYLAVLVPSLFLCGALAADHLLVWLGRWGVLVVALLALAALPASVSFDVALLADPSRAPLPAIDRFQYVTGWPAGYGLPAALAEVRRQRNGPRVLDVFGATSPPFTQALISLRDSPVRVVGVALDAPLTCGATPTLALLDEPRDAEAVFRQASPRWQRLAVYPRPGRGGAYVLYRCTAQSRDGAPSPRVLR